MHTKAFGRYNGPEEVMSVTANYTEINVIDNYAPTAKAYVTVVDASGSPVEGADVEFKIYNYAEFYSVATKKTDKEGKRIISLDMERFRWEKRKVSQLYLIRLPDIRQLSKWISFRRWMAQFLQQ
jgi:hypothetical protein